MYRKYDNIQTSYITSKLANVGKNNENSTKFVDQDLQVYILDDGNLEDSLDQFIYIYNQRSRTNNEFWLLDVSSFPSIKDAKNQLNNLTLDLDDDLFLYKIKQPQPDFDIDIFEFYEIHPSKPRKLIPLGSWSKSQGLNLTTAGKWTRRANLEVTQFLNFSLFLFLFFFFLK